MDAEKVLTSIVDTKSSQISESYSSKRRREEDTGTENSHSSSSKRRCEEDTGTANRLTICLTCGEYLCDTHANVSYNFQEHMCEGGKNLQHFATCIDILSKAMSLDINPSTSNTSALFSNQLSPIASNSEKIQPVPLQPRMTSSSSTPLSSAHSDKNDTYDEEKTALSSAHSDENDTYDEKEADEDDNDDGGNHSDS